MAVVDLAQETGTITRKERSLGAEAFRRLLKNKIAVLSATFIFVLIVIAGKIYYFRSKPSNELLETPGKKGRKISDLSSHGQGHGGTCRPQLL